MAKGDALKLYATGTMKNGHDSVTVEDGGESETLWRSHGYVTEAEKDAPKPKAAAPFGRHPGSPLHPPLSNPPKAETMGTDGDSVKPVPTREQLEALEPDALRVIWKELHGVEPHIRLGKDRMVTEILEKQEEAAAK